MKSTAIPFVPAIDLDLALARTGPAEIELSDEDLEQVVGGLQRVWLPPAAGPGVPELPEL